MAIVPSADTAWGHISVSRRNDMNIFQRAKNGILISGVFLIIVGLVLLFFPEETTRMIAYIAAVLLLVMGVSQIIGYLRSDPGMGRHNSSLVAGIFLVIAGLIVYFRAEAVISIIPIILGIIIAISGVAKLQQAVDLARMKVSRWSTVLAVSLLNIILGVVIFFNPFSTVMTLLRFVGIGLVYSGVSDVIATLYLSRRTRDYQDRY